MGQGRLFQSFCSHILLIACAIQGITPDSKDLASMNALKLFCPGLTDPHQGVDEDEFPDDVCQSLQIEMDLGLDQLANPDNLPFARIATTEAQVGSMRSDPLRFVSRHRTLTSIDGSIHRFSPLIC